MALPRHLSRETRIILYPDAILPGVQMVGRYNHTDAMPGLEPHAHEGCVEICYLARGRQVYSVGDARFHLRGGDVFMTRPAEEHSTAGLPQEKGVLYWMIIRMDAAERGILGLDAARSRDLVDRLLAIPDRLFRGAGGMHEDLDAVLLAGQGGGKTGDRLRLTHHALAFVLSVIATATGGEGSRPESPLARVVQQVGEDIGEPWTVDRMAAMARLSESRFKARFRAEYGMPPMEFVQRERVGAASKQLRETDLPITEIAFALGFGSSQYFATVFKKYTGKRPSEVRLESAEPGTQESSAAGSRSAAGSIKTDKTRRG